MSISLYNETLVDWFLESFPNVPYQGQWIATTGSFPHGEDDLDDLLERAGVKLCAFDQDVGIAVVGRTEWEESEVNGLVNRRAGRSLKIYSQEMFLAYWMSGRDPFEMREVAEAFGKGHPVYQYLATVEWDWPSTHVPPTQGLTIPIDPERFGLSDLGYRTGMKHPNPISRRDHLKRIFEMPLARILAEGGTDEWGAAKSRMRLRTMAEKLAGVCRLQKKLGHVVAVSHLETDFAWLGDTFWEPRFGYDWPRGFVPRSRRAVPPGRRR
jgi:hypothetical protein